MTGHTADISNICEYPWYDRVIFRYQPITYPYFPVILGRYLGPAIDVGSAMTYKILKANGEHVCRTIVCLLKPTKLACSYHKQLRNDFEASVLESLGPADTISGFYYKECTDLTPDIIIMKNLMRTVLKEVRMSLHHSLPPQNLMTGIWTFTS